MSKYKTLTTYFCSLCGEKYNSDIEAIDCYDSHYRLGKIIGVYYEKGKKCPSKIQIELSLDGNNYEKDVMFVVKSEGWGEK